MIRRLLVISLCAAGIFACGDDKPKRSLPHQAPSTAKNALSQAEAANLPAEKIELPFEYAYSPVGKRDPFRSYLIDEAKTAEKKVDEPVRPIENLRCGPLCKWDLEQLRLVAIVSGISNPIAMVEAPDGRGYTVRRGTFIGKRSGKVTNIRPSEMVITEIYKDNAGVPQPHEIYIALPKSPEEQMDLEGENNLMNAGIEQ
ncbi:MAG: pilus assembly protein PilP [Myxococcaceae bacterium]|nr:pilus assembly protein PilP [Myxococcaceae bacterium]